MDNMYLIPANTKKGKLIFSLFRLIDLVIFLVGLAITFVFFLAINSSSLLATIIKILPVGVCSFLVVPVAHYHNVLCFIKDLLAFYNNRRVYYWKGWCVRSEFREDK